MPGQGRRIELRHRADHHDLPARPGLRQSAEQVQIQALVDHAVEAKPGVGHVDLVGGFAATAGGEMLDVDARREGVDVGVEVSLRLVEGMAAGEDGVGPRHQRRLEPRQFGRGEAEAGEFVHAIIDDRRAGHVGREAPHHRRVEPQRRMTGAFHRQKAIEKSAQRRLALLVRQVPRQVRSRHHHAALHVGPLGEAGFALVLPDRFLEDHHGAAAREPRHQMLRTLEDEIPAEMAETDDGIVRVVRKREGGAGRHAGIGDGIQRDCFRGEMDGRGPSKPGASAEDKQEGCRASRAMSDTVSLNRIPEHT